MRRAQGFAVVNGLINIRAQTDARVSSLINADPPMRLENLPAKRFREKTMELSEKVSASDVPLGSGYILRPSPVFDDPSGYLVIIPLIDYYEMVARARRLVFDD